MRYSQITEASWLTDPLSDPAFRKWFGNSVVRDEHGQPLKVYHGTPRPFNSFSMEDATAGMLYFATDPKFASGYASTVNQGEGGRVIPCYLRIEKLYDFRTEKAQSVALGFYGYTHHYGGRGLHGWDNRLIRIALYGHADIEDEDNPEIHEEPLSEQEWMTAIKQGMYPALEAHDFVDWIRKRLKYDGMLMIEGDSINYAVFSPYQVKSAISNTGNFNRRSPKLGETRS